MSYEYDPHCSPGDSTCQPAQSQSTTGAWGAGATLGIVLIVLGVAFLVAETIPGLSWWTMWPLLIVVAGFAQIVTPGLREPWGIERVADGVGTVLIGLLLLGNTTGYISWQVWWTLLSLWPVLLISAGFALLAKSSGQEWLRILAAVPVWLTLLYAAGLWWAGAPLPLVLPALPQSLPALPFVPFQ